MVVLYCGASLECRLKSKVFFAAVKGLKLADLRSWNSFKNFLDAEVI